MAKLTRFGVSLDDDLLKQFDVLIKKTGYANRSEAIRDLIRDRLVDQEWEEGKQDVIGVLGLVYDHEKRELTENLNAIQHEHVHTTIASTHIHLDHDNCLEVIILRGKSHIVRKVADNLLSTKNVKHGRLILTTTGAGIT